MHGDQKLWSILSIFVGVLLVVQPIATLAGEVLGQNRPLDTSALEQYLARETIGDASFSPDGKYLVYERAGPYKSRREFSSAFSPAVRGGAFGSEELRMVTVTNPERGVALLKDTDGGRYWLGGAGWIAGFSPDSKKLLAYRYHDGQTNLVVVDLATREQWIVPGTPDYEVAPQSLRGPVWVNSNEFVFAALPAGEQPLYPGFRRNNGRLFAEAWRRSWQGAEASFRQWDTDVRAFSRRNSGALIAVDVSARTTRSLVVGEFGGLSVSPDGQRMAAVEFSSLPPGSSAAPEVGVGRLARLSIFTLATGRRHVLETDFIVWPSLLHWSPDGSKLAFFAWRPDQPMSSGLYQSIDGNGRVTAYRHAGLDLISSGGMGTIRIPYRPYWLGDRLAVFARRRDSGDVSSGLSPIDKAGHLLPDRVDLFALSPTSLPRSLTSALKRIGDMSWRAQSKCISIFSAGKIYGLTSDGELIEARRGDYSFRSGLLGDSVVIASSKDQNEEEIHLYDPCDRSIHALLAPLSSTEVILAASREGNSVLMHSPATGRISLRTSKKNPDTVANFVVDEIVGVVDDSRSGQKISYPSGLAGATIESCVFLPKEFLEGRRYPAIVEVYPSWRANSCTASIEARIFNERGYVYIKASSPSEIERTSVDQPYGGLPSSAVDAVDAAIDEGFVDASRVGIFGFSNGALAALWTASHKDRFGVVIAFNGMSDFYGHYFNPGGQIAIFPSGGGIRPLALSELSTGIGAMGASAIDEPYRFIDNSPLNRARDINAAVLLINSDMDTFDRRQFESMFSALARVGKTARLLTYWGESHSLSSPENIRHLYANFIQWCDIYLHITRDSKGDIVWGRSQPIHSNKAPPRPIEWYESSN